MSRAPRWTPEELAAYERSNRPRPEMLTPQTLWIPGTMPGLNEIIAAAKVRAQGPGRQWNKYNDIKQAWKSNIAILAERCGLVPVTRARFEFTWIEQTRRRDPDNIAAGGRKLILDGLVACGVLPNDDAKVVAGFSDTFEYSATEPGVRVRIMPVA